MTNPDELIEEHFKITDFLAEQARIYAENAKPYNDRLKQINAIMHEHLLLLSAKANKKHASVTTPNGTAYLSTIVTPKVVDKEKYLDWVLEDWNRRGAMLQIGAPQKDAFDEYCDANAGRNPPFTDTTTIIKCNIRKS